MGTPSRKHLKRFIALLALVGFSVQLTLPLWWDRSGRAQANPDVWRYEWPKTDFTKHSISFDEILSGGPPKDGIPSIDDPEFVPAAEVTDLGENEPVIGLTVNGWSRAYPLRVLTWHEIVNDTIGGVPVAVTYCPLCNAAIVFDRRVDGMYFFPEYPTFENPPFLCGLFWVTFRVF